MCCESQSSNDVKGNTIFVGRTSFCFIQTIGIFKLFRLIVGVCINIICNKCALNTGVVFKFVLRILTELRRHLEGISKLAKCIFRCSSNKNSNTHIQYQKNNVNLSALISDWNNEQIQQYKRNTKINCFLQQNHSD